jgi:sec-independent protein translocase protein TatA
LRVDLSGPAALCYNLFNNKGIAREDEDMGGIGAPELLIVLVIVIIIFGVGRIGKVGKELGTGIREFRKGVTGDDEKPAATDEKPKS